MPKRSCSIFRGEWVSCQLSREQARLVSIQLSYPYSSQPLVPRTVNWFDRSLDATQPHPPQSSAAEKEQRKSEIKTSVASLGDQIIFNWLVRDASGMLFCLAAVNHVPELRALMRVAVCYHQLREPIRQSQELSPKTWSRL